MYKGRKRIRLTFHVQLGKFVKFCFSFLGSFFFNFNFCYFFPPFSDEEDLDEEVCNKFDNLLSFWFSVSSLNFLFVCFGLVLLLLLCFWQNSFHLYM